MIISRLWKTSGGTYSFTGTDGALLGGKEKHLARKIRSVRKNRLKATGAPESWLEGVNQKDSNSKHASDQRRIIFVVLKEMTTGQQLILGLW